MRRDYERARARFGDGGEYLFVRPSGANHRFDVHVLDARLDSIEVFREVGARVLLDLERHRWKLSAELALSTFPRRHENERGIQPAREGGCVGERPLGSLGAVEWHENRAGVFHAASSKPSLSARRCVTCIGSVPIVSSNDCWVRGAPRGT